MVNKAQGVTGGCYCGAVRYEADVFLNSAIYCHCTICQKITGQPAEVAVPVKIGSLQWTTGSPEFFTSSEWAERGFCRQCGSRLVYSPLDPDDEWLAVLTVGSLDEPGAVTPSIHIFEDSRLPWYGLDDDLPRYRSDQMDEVLSLWKEERRTSE